jgi:hypothetical protein
MNSEPTSNTALDTVGRSLQRVPSDVREPLVGVAFWSAIALPFLHLPLLFVTGLSTPTQTVAFLALLALNVVAILAGHSYHGE